jgi:hypothetical protein
MLEQQGGLPQGPRRWAVPAAGLLRRVGSPRPASRVAALDRRHRRAQQLAADRFSLRRRASPVRSRCRTAGPASWTSRKPSARTTHSSARTSRLATATLRPRSRSPGSSPAAAC